MGMELMDTHKIVAKVYFADGAAVDFAAVVPVLHQWIRDGALADHLMIDVADYAHVQHGPGVLLVCHEANLHVEDEDGRAGLSYWRKQPVEGADFAGALAMAAKSALSSAERLERDLPGGGRFDATRLTIRLNDRLNAPNTDATFAATEAPLRALAERLFGVGATVARVATGAGLFEVELSGGESAASASAGELARRIILHS